MNQHVLLPQLPSISQSSPAPQLQITLMVPWAPPLHCHLSSDQRRLMDPDHSQRHQPLSRTKQETRSEFFCESQLQPGECRALLAFGKIVWHGKFNLQGIAASDTW